jgi:hypothetical protein
MATFAFPLPLVFCRAVSITFFPCPPPGSHRGLARSRQSPDPYAQPRTHPGFSWVSTLRSIVPPTFFLPSGPLRPFARTFPVLRTRCAPPSAVTLPPPKFENVRVCHHFVTWIYLTPTRPKPGFTGPHGITPINMATSDFSLPLVRWSAVSVSSRTSPAPHSPLWGSSGALRVLASRGSGCLFRHRPVARALGWPQWGGEERPGVAIKLRQG